MRDTFLVFWELPSSIFYATSFHAPQSRSLRGAGGRGGRGMSEMLWAGGGVGTPRFSLLHLDDGEDYVLDVVGSMTAPDSFSLLGELKMPSWRGPLRGRVRLLTKSLVFESDNLDAPVVKFPFSNVTKLEALGSKRAGFEMECPKVVCVRETGSLDAPHQTVRGEPSVPWRFHTSAEDFAKIFETTSGLLKVAKQPSSVVEATLGAMRDRREARSVFDTSKLFAETEKILFDAPAAQITPLCREPGRLVITDARVYFQPLWTLVHDTGGVRTARLEDIVAVARRRHALRPLSAELFFKRRRNASESKSHENNLANRPCVLFTLRGESEREAFCTAAIAQAAEVNHDVVLGSSLVNADETRVGGFSSNDSGDENVLTKTTRRWKKGDVSNLEYLLFLNLASGRSFNDLTQYPVMPWVLRDYESDDVNVDDWCVFRDLRRPVGALNVTRLAAFRKREIEMKKHVGGADSFLYGTHYSAPGYVLYWLLRSSPAHHLRLQGGKLDAPDRLFHGIGESWESALLSTADVKELIPEFYVSSGVRERNDTSSSFLVNGKNLPLGTRQVDGEALGDVKLPNWAKGSPALFLTKMRQALESEYVSLHVNHWIDLIFGFMQTGPLADKNNNVFHPLTYQGALTELSNTKDPTMRKAKEAQIQEFGRAPKRLFTSPHAQRVSGVHEKWTHRADDDFDNRNACTSESTAASRARDVLETLVSMLKADEEGDTTGGEVLDGLEEDVEAPVAVADEVRAFAEKSSTTKTNEKARSENETRVVPDSATLGRVHEKEEEEATPDSRDRVWCQRWTRRAAHNTRIVGIKFANEPSGQCSTSVLSVCASAIVKAHAARDGALEHANASGRRKTGRGGAPFATSLALLGAAPAMCPLKGDEVFGDGVFDENVASFHGTPVACVGCTDGGVYAYGTDQGRVLGRLNGWGVGEKIPTVPTGSEVAALATPALRPDLLFGVSRNGLVRVWDVDVGKTISAAGLVSVSGVFRSTTGVLTQTRAAVIDSAYLRAATSPMAGISPAAASAGPPLHVAELVSAAHPGRVSNTMALCCDPHATLVLVAGTDAEITAWDPRCARAAWVTGAFVGNHRAVDGGVVGLSVSPSKGVAFAACADGGVSLLDLRRCGEVREMIFFDTALSCLAGNENDDRVFVGGADGTVAAWRWSERLWGENEPQIKVVVRSVSPSPVSCLAVAAEGDALAVGWDDGAVGVFQEKREARV